MSRALPLPFPYLPGTVEPDSFEDRVQQNFDALAIALGSLNEYSAWTVPTLANSWVAYSGTRPAPRYYKTNGFVYCEGAVKNGSAASAAVFTFPAGSRPAYIRDFVGINDSNALVAGTVTAAGVLSFVAGGSTVFTSFQVMFRAEQ